MTKEEALEIFRANIEEARAQIAAGHFYTHEQAWEMLRKRKPQPVT